MARRNTDRDILTLEAIQRHWWLPSHYLHEFTKGVARNMFGHRRRLLRLVEEGLIERPEDLNNPNVKNDFLSYALTPKGKAVLENLGKKFQYSVAPSGGFAHAAMTVAITGNIDIEATKAGFEYITDEEIFQKAPAATKKLKNRLALPTKIEWEFHGKLQRSDQATTPDRLFGIKYGDEYRFFAVEADLATETRNPTKGFKNSSILRKLLAYKNVFETGVYKSQWGIPNLMVLFVTTSEQRMLNMIADAKDLYPRGCGYLLFNWLPGFSFFHKSPALAPKLWNEPWLRAGRDPFDISQPY